MIQRPFFLMRILAWLIIILAAWGILQYCVHAWSVMHLQQLQPVDTRTYWELLAWDAIYVLAAGLMIAAAAGCLMWRPWARPMLRALAWMLALYSLASAVVLFAQWQGTDPTGMDLVAQHMDPAVARGIAMRTRRIMLMGIVFKTVAVPLLAWLGWRLGQADVVRRFEG